MLLPRDPPLPAVAPKPTERELIRAMAELLRFALPWKNRLRAQLLGCQKTLGAEVTDALNGFRETGSDV